MDAEQNVAACLAEHASRGPRYTSYPPATEFGPIDAELVTREVASVVTSPNPISLYMHVPFCRSLCAYCGCNVIPTRDESRGDGYVEHLLTEMALVARGHVVAPVAEIALGGGSPNFLPPRLLRRLLEATERYFPMLPDARRSIELDPRTTTTAQLETLGELKFNSMSVGVQDFDERVQDAIRRHQTVVQTKWIVDRARAAGLQDINIDVVYGLPRQTPASFGKTLDAVIDLAPDRVALFGYAHLPDKLPHQRIVERAGRVLDTYERATLFLKGVERFAAAGYIQIGLDHFARADSSLALAARERRLTRTFQGYVEKRSDSILGFGTSAISCTPHMYWQNHPSLAPWEKAIAARELPIHRGCVLDVDDRARRSLISTLMCNGEVDLDALGIELGIDAETYFEPELAALAGHTDLARFDRADHRITTTEMGKMLVRNVCMLFDRYYVGEKVQRFSSTI
ncbi:MAG: oxygen-independent coproporphyrinogen III oxidase [Kofleriaceae bacterium]